MDTPAGRVCVGEKRWSEAVRARRSTREGASGRQKTAANSGRRKTPRCGGEAQALIAARMGAGEVTVPAPLSCATPLIGTGTFTASM